MPQTHRPAALAVPLLLAAAASGQLPQYTFEVLADDGVAADLNDAGQVVGTADLDDNGEFEGFVWSRDSGFTTLGIDGDLLSAVPAAIGPDGTVAGLVTGPMQSDERAAFWPAGDYASPATLPDPTQFDGVATAVDGTGRVYGEAGQPRRAYDYGRPGAPAVNPIAPVDSGVGGAGPDFAVGDVGDEAAVLRADGTFDVLADPGPAGGLDAPFGYTSFARATARDGNLILGNVINGTILDAAVARPVVWDGVDGTATQLDSFDPPFDIAIGSDINDAGLVVGSIGDPASVLSRVAVIWDDAGLPTDLNDLVAGLPDGVTLTAATGINADGTIVGGYTDSSLPPGQDVGVFVLTIVPEPAAATFAAAGLLALRRRR